MSSTFSSIGVTSWGSGTSAASKAKQATGRLARFPNNPMQFSIPQKELSKRGLMMTMSATGYPSKKHAEGYRRNVPTTTGVTMSAYGTSATLKRHGSMSGSTPLSDIGARIAYVAE
jgi:hypothetical protein